MSIQRQHRISRTGLAAIGLLVTVLFFTGCSHCGSPWKGGHHSRNFDAHEMGSPWDNSAYERTPAPSKAPGMIAASSADVGEDVTRDTLLTR